MIMRKTKIKQVLKELRGGSSLFSACQKAGVETALFYKILAENKALRKDYQLALSDYADQCTDEIKAIVAALKAGDIDNPTAKLLIETEKWLAQKFCNAQLWDVVTEADASGKPTEIVVKFI